MANRTDYENLASMGLESTARSNSCGTTSHRIRVCVYIYIYISVLHMHLRTTEVYLYSI